MARLLDDFGLRAQAGQAAALWPTCAICNKPVDALHCEYAMAEDAQIFVAECHGDRETTKLTAMDMARRLAITGGVAFATKRLPAVSNG